MLLSAPLVGLVRSVGDVRGYVGAWVGWVGVVVGLGGEGWRVVGDEGLCGWEVVWWTGWYLHCLGAGRLVGGRRRVW